MRRQKEKSVYTTNPQRDAVAAVFGIIGQDLWMKFYTIDRATRSLTPSRKEEIARIVGDKSLSANMSDDKFARKLKSILGY